MKQLIYYASIIFCCIACEAKLTDYPYATVSLNATVDQNSFFFEGITSLQNDEILERGFVLLVPRRMEVQGNAMIGIYQYKIVLQPDELFEHRLQGGWEKGTSCEAYAYIQTSNGYYRSPIKTLKTPAPAAPVINKVEVSNGEYGAHLLTVIGENFADNATSIQPRCRYFDYMRNQVDDMDFEIISAKPDTLVLKTRTNASGELPFELTVNGLAATSKSTFTIPAPVKLLSIEPQYPRCGESVTLRMEGLKKEDFHWLYLNGFEGFWTQDVGPLAIEEVEDNLIRFRLYTTIATDKTIKEGNVFISTKSSQAISTVLPFKISFPWKEVGSLKYGVDNRSIGHDGKIYWGNAYKLVAYGIATAEYEVYNFPDQSPDWWCQSLVLCVLNDYIYIYEPNEYYKDNRLLRFHTKTKEWEVLGYLPNTPTWDVSAVILNSKQIYMNLGNAVGAYSFDTETNVLKKTDKIAEGYYVKYIGTYDNYVYYKSEDSYSIYRKALDRNTGEELYLDVNSFLGGGNSIRITDIVMTDRYIYFVYDVCTFRIDVSSADLSIESLGTAENNLESWYLAPTQEGIYAIDRIRMYKYSE